MNKTLKILAAAVDVLLLIDIASDLVKKYKARKASRNTNAPTTVDDDTVEETGSLIY